MLVGEVEKLIETNTTEVCNMIMNSVHLHVYRKMAITFHVVWIFHTLQKLVAHVDSVQGSSIVEPNTVVQ